MKVKSIVYLFMLIGGLTISTDILFAGITGQIDEIPNNNLRY